MEPKCVYDMPFEDYLKINALSQSKLKLLLESPWKFNLSQNNKLEFEDSTAMRLGRIVHCRLLEPHYFANRYLIKPKITRRGSQWNEYMAEMQQGGFEDIIFTNEMLVIKEIVDSAIQQLSYAGLDGLFNFDTGFKEVSLFWRDKTYDVDMKARLDYLSDNGKLIVDVKTTSQQVNSSKLKWHMRDLGYHTQAYTYIEAVRQVLGFEVEDYIFFFINTKAPYLTRFFRLNQMTIEHEGSQNYIRAMEMYNKCKSDDYWPVGPDIERGLIEEIE